MLIKSGRLVLADGVKNADLRLENGRITEIDIGLTPCNGEDVEDVSGCFIVPGGIDAHTHFDMPAGDFHTADDFSSGTRAALLGGTTTVVDFAECDGDAPLQSGLDAWREKADGKTFCDYGLHMTVSHWDDTMAQQMADMVTQGVTAFKVYTAYQSDIGVTDGELFQILRAAAKLGATVCVHCENGEVLDVLWEELDPALVSNHASSRPNEVEAEAVSKVLHLARLTGGRVYIVHLSTAEGLDAVRAARAAGVRVTAETCPHYLLLNDSCYQRPYAEAAKFVMSPPLRSPTDCEALWSGLGAKEIQTIATDHCAFTKAQKLAHPGDYRKIPNGIPGVEHRMVLTYHHGLKRGLSMEQLVELTAGNPARAMGLYPQKGCIAVGSDADLTILDASLCTVISAAKQAQAVDYTPFEGMETSLSVRSVYLRGERVVENGAFIKDRPAGTFLAGKIPAEKEGTLPWER